MQYTTNKNLRKPDYTDLVDVNDFNTNADIIDAALGDMYTKDEVATVIGTFDLIIRTQAEFEAMIDSDTWLGTKSVCFVGDGGTTAFTLSNGRGLKIPQTVMSLQGLNGAKIEVTDFHYSPINKAALWYATQPDEDAGYWIDGLSVSCEGSGYGYGFHSCVQLTNCTGDGYGGSTGNIGRGYGFSNCSKLTNCTGNGEGNDYAGAYGYGFSNCTRLTNCTGNGEGYCEGDGTGYGFADCEQLTNCNGTGDGNADGYGFYNCDYLSGCKESDTPKTALFYDCTHIATTSITVNGASYEADGDGDIDLGDVGGGVFDLVIRTQAEFEAMYESDTWLNAKSVCFVGDGGATAFTRSDGIGLKIPQTVMNIQGLNGAIIEVTSFAHDNETNKAGLWYDEIPNEDAGYRINGIDLSVLGDDDSLCNGFYNCVNLSECTASAQSTPDACGDGNGFLHCRNLMNCSGTGTGYIFGRGFDHCVKLTNCIGSGISVGSGQLYCGVGLYHCTQLSNCTGMGTGTLFGIGFQTCTQLSNCTGHGIGDSTSFVFYSCDWISGCTSNGGEDYAGVLFKNCTNIAITASEATDEETAISLSDANPNVLYFWEEA